MEHDVFSPSFFCPLNEVGWTVCIARLGFIRRSIESSSWWSKGYVHHVHTFSLHAPNFILSSLFRRKETTTGILITTFFRWLEWIEHLMLFSPLFSHLVLPLPLVSSSSVFLLCLPLVSFSLLTDYYSIITLSFWFFFFPGNSFFPFVLTSFICSSFLLILQDEIKTKTREEYVCSMTFFHRHLRKSNVSRHQRLQGIWSWSGSHHHRCRCKLIFLHSIFVLFQKGKE